jgi:hypothetical protein
MPVYRMSAIGEIRFTVSAESEDDARRKAQAIMTANADGNAVPDWDDGDDGVDAYFYVDLIERDKGRVDVVETITE